MSPCKQLRCNGPPARSKNTIDTVYAKLQKAEAEGEAGVHGASTGEVMESVLQVGWRGCWGGGAVGRHTRSVGGLLLRWRQIAARYAKGMH